MFTEVLFESLFHKEAQERRGGRECLKIGLYFVILFGDINKFLKFKMNNWEEEVNRLVAELDVNLDGICPLT